MESQLINMHSQASASLKRINAMMNEPIEIKDENPIKAKIEGAISFKNFSFT